MTRDAFLRESMALADRLCDAAVARDDVVRWIASTPPSPDPDAPAATPLRSTLDGTIYSGNAGIALFLARVYRHSRDPRHKKFAVGALATALRTAASASGAGRSAAEARLGFYAGSVGTAFAAFEAAQTLEASHLASAARGLLERSMRSIDGASDLDIIGGHAGAISALRALEPFVDVAPRWADMLARRLIAAQRPDGGWPSPLQRSGGRPLCGWSHGAAGIAWALSWHASTTGDDQARLAAERAWDYEAACFDAASDNWPRHDLPPRRDGAPEATLSWCHGSPGGMLARATLPPKSRTSARLKELRRAEKPTVRWIEHLQDLPGTDTTLCHGLLGVSEALSVAREALGDEAASDGRRVATWAIERFGEDARTRWGPSVRWPTVLPYEEHPSLLNGLAGIGHALLRIHDPRCAPTLLLPGRLFRA